MRLNDAVNLVLPVGEKQAFHVPLSREVFEANYRILAATKAALSSKGIYYQMDAGPRIAALTLLDEARKDAEERGNTDDAGQGRDTAGRAILGEIKRLTTIICEGTAGFDPLPVEAAISAGHIDADDWREAESALVFFTCLYSLAPKAAKTKTAEAVASILPGSITASSLSEYASSLQNSTTAEPLTKGTSSLPT